MSESSFLYAILVTVSVIHSVPETTVVSVSVFVSNSKPELDILIGKNTHYFLFIRYRFL